MSAHHDNTAAALDHLSLAELLATVDRLPRFTPAAEQAPPAPLVIRADGGALAFTRTDGSEPADHLRWSWQGHGRGTISPTFEVDIRANTNPRRLSTALAKDVVAQATQVLTPEHFATARRDRLLLEEREAQQILELRVEDLRKSLTIRHQRALQLAAQDLPGDAAAVAHTMIDAGYTGSVHDLATVATAAASATD